MTLVILKIASKFYAVKYIRENSKAEHNIIEPNFLNGKIRISQGFKYANMNANFLELRQN